MSTPFLLGREGNRVTIAGDFGIQDVRKVFAVIHETVNNRGHSDIELDFSRCTAAFSGAMLPLCAHVMLLERNRIDFQLILPEIERVRRLFERSAWAHFLCPRDHEYPRHNDQARQLPAARYSTHEDQENTLVIAGIKVLKLTEYFVPS